MASDDDWGTKPTNIRSLAAARQKRDWQRAEEARRKARWSLDDLLGPPCWPLQDPER